MRKRAKADPPSFYCRPAAGGDRAPNIALERNRHFLYTCVQTIEIGMGAPDHDHRRRRRARTGSTGRSVDYRRLVNPFEPMRVFTDDKVEAIHQNALRILQDS